MSRNYEKETQLVAKADKPYAVWVHEELNKENITDLEIKNDNKLIISTQNNDKFIIKDKQYFSLFFTENYIPSNPGGQTDQFIKTTHFEVICNDIKEGRSTPQNTGYNFANSGSYFIDFSYIPNSYFFLHTHLSRKYT